MVSSVIKNRLFKPFESLIINGMDQIVFESIFFAEYFFCVKARVIPVSLLTSFTVING